jgi:apolipoprotein N-acyltransferase
MSRKKKPGETANSSVQTDKSNPEAKKNPPLWRDALITALSAAILFLAFHPVALRHLIFIGFVPWFALILARRPRRAAFIGWLGGFLWYGLAVSWVTKVHILGPLPIAAILGLYTMVFALIIAAAREKCRRWLFILAPAAWVSIEFIRSIVGALSFHWFIAGHSLAEWLPFIQIADITGIYGVSFVIIAVNFAVLEFADAIVRKRRIHAAPLVFAAALAAAALAYGFVRMSQLEVKQGPSALVAQGNIPQFVKERPGEAGNKTKEEIFDDHIRLAQPAMGDCAVDIVIWPETILPWALEEEPELARFFSDFAKRARAALLLGSQERVITETGIEYYNAAYYLDNRGRIAGRYRKSFLAPIGEYVPFKDWLPFLPKFFGLFTPYGTSGFAQGREQGVFDLAGRRFGVLICFEISAPELVRRLKCAGADFVVTISNDAWFEDGAELDMSRAQTIVRAVESRVGVVRAVNGGISSFIDPAGRARDFEAAGKKKMVEGRLFGNVSFTESRSVYALIGDAFAALLSAVTAFALVCSFLARRKTGTGPAGGAGQN